MGTPPARERNGPHSSAAPAAGERSRPCQIDRVVTNRWLGLPIFAAVMFLVYYIAMVTVGSWATDWANDGLFGDGWHLFGIGSGAYGEDADAYGEATNVLDAFVGIEEDAEPAAVISAAKAVK